MTGKWDSLYRHNIYWITIKKKKGRGGDLHTAVCYNFGVMSACELDRSPHIHGGLVVCSIQLCRDVCNHTKQLV